VSTRIKCLLVAVWPKLRFRVNIKETEGRWQMRISIADAYQNHTQITSILCFSFSLHLQKNFYYFFSKIQISAIKHEVSITIRSNYFFKSNNYHNLSLCSIFKICLILNIQWNLNRAGTGKLSYNISTIWKLRRRDTDKVLHLKHHELLQHRWWLHPSPSGRIRQYPSQQFHKNRIRTMQFLPQYDIMTLRNQRVEDNMLMQPYYIKTFNTINRLSTESYSVYQRIVAYVWSS